MRSRIGLWPHLGDKEIPCVEPALVARGTSSIASTLRSDSVSCRRILSWETSPKEEREESRRWGGKRTGWCTWRKTNSSTHLAVMIYVQAARQCESQSPTEGEKLEGLCWSEKTASAWLSKVLSKPGFEGGGGWKEMIFPVHPFYRSFNAYVEICTAIAAYKKPEGLVIWTVAYWILSQLMICKYPAIKAWLVSLSTSGKTHLSLG